MFINKSQCLFSAICSGVIVLTVQPQDASPYCMALTCAHLLFPIDTPDAVFVELRAKFQGIDRKCEIVDQGNYHQSNEPSNDWIRVKIHSGEDANLQDGFTKIIPSPSLARSVNHFSDPHTISSEIHLDTLPNRELKEKQTFPSIFTTLLYGYFVKGDVMDPREVHRLETENMDLLDIWKMVPQERMSASLGWTSSFDGMENIVHKCGATPCCSGSPIFKCRILQYVMQSFW